MISRKCSSLFTSFFAIVFLGLISTTSNAGIKEVLDEMYMNASTPAQAYNSQVAGGYFGGSMSYRSPARNFNVIAFTPPRIEAGCGGFDMMGGSFSIMSSSEFEGLIRQIAANALGYALKLAIQEMCKGCAETLNEIQKTIQEFNKSFKDTCQMAQSFVNSTGIDQGAKNLGKAINSSMEWISSGIKSWGKTVAQLDQGTAEMCKDESGNINQSCLGNIFYKEIVKSNIHTFMPLLGTPEETIDMIMSVLGTCIIEEQDKKLVPRCHYGKRLSISQMVSKSTATSGLTKWHCNPDDECQLPEAQEYTQIGIDQLIEEALGVGGDADGNLVLAPSVYPNTLSLLQVYADPSVGANAYQRLHPIAKGLVNTTKFPMVRSLRPLIGNTGALASALDQMQPYLLARMKTVYGEYILDIFTKVQTKLDKVDMPDMVIENINDVKKEVERFRREEYQAQLEFPRVLAFIEATAKNQSVR